MTWGWLATKLQNGRISVQTSEFRSALQKLRIEQRAEVLAMAAILRLKFQSEIPEEVFLRPAAVPEKFLRNTYGMFEDTVNLARTQAKQLTDGAIGLPPMVSRQVILTNQALGTWMASIGAALNAKTRGDVNRCWELFLDCVNDLPAAIQKFKGYEAEGLFSGLILPTNLVAAALRFPKFD